MSRESTAARLTAILISLARRAHRPDGTMHQVREALQLLEAGRKWTAAETILSNGGNGNDRETRERSIARAERKADKARAEMTAIVKTYPAITLELSGGLVPVLRFDNCNVVYLA